jgi:hypothetical protein
MSIIKVSRVDIDLLVHLAVAGPAGATDWRAQVSDGEAFGAKVWQHNYLASWDRRKEDPGEERVPPDYTFTPPPVALTVVEGIKHCA